MVTPGHNFPDALAAAAVAGRENAPILLVSPGFIPESTGVELARLRPERIVVLGGEIDRSLHLQLQDYLPH